MKPITEIKKGDWLSAADVAATFPGVSIKTIYRWRAKIKAGIIDANKYPRTTKMGDGIYVYKPDLIERINRTPLDEAS